MKTIQNEETKDCCDRSQQEVFYYFESDLVNPNFVDEIINRGLRGDKVEMMMIELD